jgi:hypothetical protein
MPRFVLINPSIKGIGGHYLDYGMHVLAAAKRAGYETVLGTHSQLAATAAEAVLQANVVESGRVLAVCRYEHIVRPSEWPCLHLASRIGRVVIGLGGLLKPISNPSKPLADTAEDPVAQVDALRRESKKRTLATRLRNAHSILVEKTAASYYSWATWATHRAKADSFYESLSQILRQNEFSDGDVVFLPDVTWAEVEGVRRFLADNPTAHRATWHFVLRYNLFKGREPDYPSQVRKFGRARRLLQSLEPLYGTGVVRFYCDTRELCEQYNHLSSIEFESIPIPHTIAALDGVSAFTSTAPIRAIYLGGARAEKGYRLLPRLVRGMWPEYVKKDRLVFSIQSSFDIVGGGSGIAEARADLQRFPPEKVAVLCQPFQSEDYQKFKDSGNISLVLYDPDAYYARSSGILAESLAAGMTVLATAGTWAAAQFADAARDHQIAFREKAKVLKAIVGSLKGEGDGPMTVGGQSKPWKEEHAVPIGANALFGVVSGMANPGQFLKVRIELAEPNGKPLSIRHAVVGPLTSGKSHHFLLPLERSATSISIRVWNAFDSRQLTIPQWSIEFLECASGDNGFPRSAVGLAVADVEDAAESLQELVDHFPHYRETARRFASSFFEWHNADRLVGQLAAVRPSCEVSSKVFQAARAGPPQSNN